MPWFKGNVHMHSFWSDGQQFPELAAAHYKDAGYHFVAFTEHDRLQAGEQWIDCEEQPVIRAAELLDAYSQRCGAAWIERDGSRVRLRTMDEYREQFEQADRFLIMAGEEITTKSNADTHYINALNLRSPVPPQQHEAPVGETIDAVVAAAMRGGDNVLVSFNHPNYRFNATAEELAASNALTHMEMYTALTSCVTNGDALHASPQRMWDVALSLRLARGGAIMYGLAADDCHVYTAINYNHGRDGRPQRAWVHVRAASLTADNVIDALRAGDFYGSTGVALNDIEITKDALRITIKSDDDARYAIRFIGTRRDSDLTSQPVISPHGDTLRTTRQYGPDVGATLAVAHGCDATYRFRGDEQYVRAEIISDRYIASPTGGLEYQRAWTQPIQPNAPSR